MYASYGHVKAYHQQRNQEWWRRAESRQRAARAKWYHAVVSRVGAALVHWGEKLETYGAPPRSIPRTASK